MKRIAAEKMERQQQWRVWEADLKKTYAREKQRFTNALAKLETEMKDALSQQEQARGNVRNAASGEANDPMEEITTVTDEEFAALMGGTMTDPREDSQDAVLQRALAASMQVVPSNLMMTSFGTTSASTPPTSRAAPRNSFDEKAKFASDPE